MILACLFGAHVPCLLDGFRLRPRTASACSCTTLASAGNISRPCFVCMHHLCLCVLPRHPGDGASGEVFGSYYKQQRVAVKARREGKGQAAKGATHLHCAATARVECWECCSWPPGSAHSPVNYLSQLCAPSPLPVVRQIFVAERSPDGHSRDEMAIAFSGEGWMEGWVGSQEELEWQVPAPGAAVELTPLAAWNGSEWLGCTRQSHAAAAATLEALSGASIPY